MDGLIEFLNRTSVQENIYIGVGILIFDILVTVFLVRLLLERHEQSKWEKTRQHLSYVLITSTCHVIRDYRACFVQHGGHIMLNAEIELHARRLDLAIRNLSEQITVHLPAFVPGISENLSLLVEKLSGLHESVLAMRLYLQSQARKLSTDIKPEDMQNYFVSPANFEADVDGRISLKDGAPQIEANYFVLWSLQVSERTVKVCEMVIQFSNIYNRGWKNLDVETKEKADSKQKYLEEESRLAIAEDALIKECGLYLLKYKPNINELAMRSSQGEPVY
jgi:hypothetical protein